MRVEAGVIVVSCGAVNSAILLLRSANASIHGASPIPPVCRTTLHGPPGDDDAGVPSVPREHGGVPEDARDQRFLPARAGRAVPARKIQSQGRTHGRTAKVVGDTWFSGRVTWVPEWAYDAWVARGVDWLAMSEDLPREDNRVTPTEDGRIRLEYTPNNEAAHAQLVCGSKRMLRRLGAWKVMTASHRAKNTTHQCGTLVFGHDAASSVLDPYCRTHDIPNLFVVDASFFPSSSAVNPGLTIVAQALRVADHLRRTDLRVPEDAAAGLARGGAAPMKVQSFSHVGITVSDFHRFVQFYAAVFGCPLVGVSDAPPERVRSFFGVWHDHDAPNARSGGFGAGRRHARDFRLPAEAPARAHPLEPRRADAFQLRGAQHPQVDHHLKAKGVEIVSTPGAIAAGPLVFLCARLRRQPDRDDRPAPHVLRARLARAARRVVSAADVPAVLRVERDRGAGYAGVPHGGQGRS